jgi:hypothetical protein
MSKLVSILLSAAIIIGLVIIVFAFWNYLRQPNAEQIAKAFPEDSFEVFNNGKNITLYSLEPQEKNDRNDTFHGYKILKETVIDSSSKQFLLKRSLTNGMIGSHGAACFNPRHGLRIVDGEKTVDIVICFECGNFETHYDGKTGESSVESHLAEFFYNRFL